MITVAEPEYQVGSLRHGDNVCLFYQRPEEELISTVPFVQEALETEDRCAYVTAGAPEASLLAALESADVDVHEAQRSGQLVILTREEFYPEDEVEPSRLAHRIAEAADAAIEAGFRGLRLFLEASWIRGPEATSMSLEEWNAAFNEVFSRAPLVLVCAYNRQTLPAQVLQFGLRAHPLMALGSCVHPNPYYEPPAEVLGQNIQDARVAWMLDQIQRAHAVDRALRAQASEQAVVAELGQLALAGAGISEIMEQTVNRVRSALGADLCGIMELLPDGAGFLLRAGAGWRDGAVGRATAGAGAQSLAGYTLATSGPVIVEDLSAETRFVPWPFLAEHGIVSSVGVAIRQRERPFGVLAVHSARRRRFSEEDVNFLRSVANVVASALDRAQGEEEMSRLLAGEQQARARAEMAERRREAQYKATSVLLQEPPIESAGPKVLEVICSALDRQLGVLWVVDEQAGVLRSAAMCCEELTGVQPYVDATKRAALRRDEDSAGRVWASGKPEWVDDIAASEGPRREAAQQAGLHTAMFFPIRAGHDTLGVIEMARLETKYRDDEMLQSMAVLGYQLGDYMERKRAEETILRLSTPVLPIAKSLLLVPVIRVFRLLPGEACEGQCF